ncbi:MAG TPA: HAMP domain-containing protein [Campylobacterales bacterium]|nr:HAMP domain-containing protein [Campylobacterales bacterium]
MKIIDMIRSSLHHKVLVAFLVVGIVPYFLIILYFTYLGREMIMHHELETYTLQAKQTKTLMQNRLSQLEQEILFLSKLELFDDMISEDMDRRISRLLEQKSRGLKEEAIILLALDSNGTIIATSHSEMLEKNNLLQFDTRRQNGTQIVDKNMFFFSTLKASFDNRHLGHLVAVYPLENLSAYFVHSQGIDFEIKDTQNSVIVHSNIQKSEIDKTTIQVSLGNMLEGYTLTYSITDDQIFAFINRFMLYLTLLLFIGIVVIIFSSRRLTKQIVTPITALTDTAKEIIETKRYDLYVQSVTVDETSELAKAFNRLVETTGKTLQALDFESKVRMQRFIDLTDMFNHITQIDNKEACIKASIEQLEPIVPHDLSFISADELPPNNAVSVAIQLHDFSTHEQKLYGHLVVDKTEFDDLLESRFFNSVVSMIALQIERIELVSKIESASNAKTSFISNMSHELRTPLNAIIGFSQYMITYESLSDDQLQTIAKIERSAMHLFGMINDILDIAKIEAGKIEIVYEKVDLFALLQECIELIAPMAEEKGLFIMGLEDIADKVMIKTDSKLVKQVVINLLSNAVKFTESGGIDIAIKAEKDNVIVTISDTGIGINKEELKMVFDEFVQLQNSNQVKHKGTGLGLSLSLHIMHALGGELLLESEGKGHGTKAILKLLQS